MRFQSIAAKLAFAGFAIGLLTALIASLGTRLGYWHLHYGLNLLAPAVAMGIMGVVAGVSWLASALRSNSGEGAAWGVAGLIGSLVLVGVPADELWLAYNSPPIHDVSTDIEYAPQFEALLPLRKGAHNGPDYDGPKTVVYEGKKTTVAALQKKYYGDVIPFVVFGKPIKLFWRALNAANAMGWHVVFFDPKQNRIEATDTSFWFGLTSDIVIRVRPAGKLGARLDVRSKSRVGENDLGSNAERIRAYIKRMKAM